MDARFSKRELVPKHLRCAQYGDTAVLEFEWDCYATAREDGSAAVSYTHLDVYKRQS